MENNVLKQDLASLQMAKALKQLLQLYLLRTLENYPELRRSLGNYKIVINVTM